MIITNSLKIRPPLVLVINFLIKIVSTTSITVEEIGTEIKTKSLILTGQTIHTFKKKLTLILFLIQRITLKVINLSHPNLPGMEILIPSPNHLLQILNLFNQLLITKIVIFLRQAGPLCRMKQNLSTLTTLAFTTHSLIMTKLTLS